VTAPPKAAATAETEALADGDGGGRPMRADARRNYERLVTAARQVFNEEGGNASMEAIAKEAGVGVGTLYRHFPRRIDLVEAVYRNDVNELTEAADLALASEGPWQALVTWLEAFVRYALGKRRFLQELHEAFEKNPELRVASRDRIDRAAAAVLERAQQAGVVRTDVGAADLMQLLGPMCTNPALSPDGTERLLGMIIDGLRHPASAS